MSALFQHRRDAAFYVRRDISPIIAIRRTSDYVEKDMSDMLAADIPVRADVFSAGSKKKRCMGVSIEKKRFVAAMANGND